VHIRPATEADIDAMLALEHDAPGAAQWSRQQYQSAMRVPERRWLVIASDDEPGILGFVVARSSGKESEIENIVVTASARRRGLGTRLLNEVVQLARSEGAEEIFLEVRESNREARTFYEGLQFVEAGRRWDYYREPAEDAILYRRTLAGPSKRQAVL